MSRTSTRVTILFNNPYAPQNYDYPKKNLSDARAETGEKARERLDEIRRNVETSLKTINWCDGLEIRTALAGIPIDLVEDTFVRVEVTGTSDISDETIISDVQSTVDQHLDAEVKDVLIAEQPPF